MRPWSCLSLSILLACAGDEPTDDTIGASSTGAAEATGPTDTGSDPSVDTGAESSSGAADTAADSTDTGAEPTGEQRFMQLCASCHGADAKGTMLAYDIRHPRREYARWVVRNGRAGTELAPSVMAPFGEDLLPDTQLDAIFDFLDALPVETTGEGLYLDHCRACHGLDAAGGESQKDIRDEVDEAHEKIRDGEGGNDYGARTEYMPSWTSAELGDDDVAAIIAYVESL